MPRLEASRKANRLVAAFEQSGRREADRKALLRFIARLERQAARTELRAVINTVLGYLANADDDPTCFIENTLRKAL